MVAFKKSWTTERSESKWLDKAQLVSAHALLLSLLSLCECECFHLTSKVLYSTREWSWGKKYMNLLKLFLNNLSNFLFFTCILYTKAVLLFESFWLPEIKATFLKMISNSSSAVVWTHTMIGSPPHGAKKMLDMFQKVAVRRVLMAAVARQSSRLTWTRFIKM